MALKTSIARMKSLAVVAHPDDELIWMGGFILRNKNWDWTIVSMCRKDDKDRKPKFEKVCKLLNARNYFISDLDDENLERSVDEKEIEARLFGLLKTRMYDCIFTHGKNGEYGHIRHKEVHRAVSSFVKSKKIVCKKIFYFDYIKEGDLALANKNADLVVNLNSEELKIKKEIITKDYGFHMGGFEELCCAATESFRVEKI